MFLYFVLLLYFIVLQFSVCFRKNNIIESSYRRIHEYYMYIFVKNISFSTTELFIHFLIFQHVRRSIEAKMKPKTWYQDTCETTQTDRIYVIIYGKWKKDWFMFNFFAFCSFLLQSNGKRLTVFCIWCFRSFLPFQQMAATLFSVFSIETFSCNKCQSTACLTSMVAK